MDKVNQYVTAYYTIVLKGNAAQIKKAVDLLDDTIDDQVCFSEYLEASRKEKLKQKRVTSVDRKTKPKYVEKRYSWDKYVEDDEDDEEDILPEYVEKRYSWDKYAEDDEEDEETHPEFVEKRYSWDKHLDDSEDDDEDFDQVDDDENDGLEVKEERFDVTGTHSCVWIEDISRLANDLAYYIPDVSFSIVGLIEDSTDGVDDLMDFGIEYSNKKLSLRKTCWYICVHMDEFDGYDAFSRKFSDWYGNPRYSEEDYLGFLDCADEWYVLDSGQGEFSTDVPFEDAVRVKVKKPKKTYY